MTFDTANLIMIGGNDPDMLLAFHRMLPLGGGVVVATDGKILAELALPLGGVTSDQPPHALDEEIVAIERALHDLGCPHEEPFLAVQILTFTAIPAQRIRKRGLWDVRRSHLVPLIIEEGEA